MYDVFAKSMEKYPINIAEVVEKRKVETMSFRVSKHSLCVPFTFKFVSLQRSANTSTQYLSQLCDTKGGFK